MSTQSGIPTEISGIFARKSSGLVRNISTFDTFLYCLIQAAIPYVLFNVAYWVFYPGANMEIAAIVGLVGSLIVGITYGLYTAIYPRSGGEYVPLSRTLHPIIGFIAGFSQTFWQIFYFALSNAFAASLGIAPLLTVLALLTGNKTLLSLGQFFSTKLGWFLFGIVMIALFSILLYRGMKFYFSFQKWVVMIGLVAFVIFIIVLGLGASGVFHFQNNFDRYAGVGAYTKLLADARAAGVDLNPPFNFGVTMAFMMWPAFSYLFSVLSISFSGEVKNVQRGQLIGIAGGQVIAGVLIILTQLFARLAIGGDFLRAAGYIGAVSPDKFPLPYPWLTMLSSIMSNNIVLTFIINLGVVLLLWFAAGSAAIYATRGLLAFGIDGIGPSALAKVSDRYHSPTIAILVAAVMALVILSLYCFTNWLTVISGLAPFAAVFLLTTVAAMIFPFRRRETYQASPTRFEVVGIPVITILGFLGSLFCAFLLYRAFVDNTYAANTPQSLGMMIAIFVIGAIWYFIARAIRRKQGVDMESRFKEIPIE